jgi:predicted Zn-dependent protease with MMP-like domain
MSETRPPRPDGIGPGPDGPVPWDAGGPDTSMPDASEPGDREDAARDAFAELVWQAVDALREALDEPYATQIGEVAFLTEDIAPPERQPPGGVLLGLFEGVPRKVYQADYALMPPRITVYRSPHERMYPDPVARANAVGATVRHEIAHYFGTDEAGIRAIERANRTGPPRL